MPTRSASHRLSRLGFGCGRIGSFNNPMSERDTARLLAHALDRGVTLFDTADIYGQGDSERAVGKLLRGRRDAAFVVTKVGQRFSPAMRVLRPLKPLLKQLLARSASARAGVTGQRTGAMRTDFTPTYVAAAIDRSLARLGFDAIDALLLHSPDPRDLLIDDLHRVLADARQAGKILSYGVACDTPACVATALLFPDLAFLEVAPPVLAAADEIITEAARSRGVRVLVREVIRYRGTVTAMGAVAAMAARPAVAAVVASTSSTAHLDDLIAAAGVAGPIRRSVEQDSRVIPLTAVATSRPRLV